MYPHEIKEFIQKRNNKLYGKEIEKVISIKENPQLTHISYNPYDNRYKLWDRYGNDYEFEAIPYQEKNKVKELVK